MASWQFRTYNNRIRLFHRHDDLMVFILNIHSACQICKEKVPDGVKMQSLLLEPSGAYWATWSRYTIYVIDSNFKQDTLCINVGGTPGHFIFSYKGFLQDKAKELLKQYGFYEKQ